MNDLERGQIVGADGMTVAERWRRLRAKADASLARIHAAGDAVDEAMAECKRWRETPEGQQEQREWEEEFREMAAAHRRDAPVSLDYYREHKKWLARMAREGRPRG
jgi:Xaa-Pro aminopeptidase